MLCTKRVHITRIESHSTYYESNFSWEHVLSHVCRNIRRQDVHPLVFIVQINYNKEQQVNMLKLTILILGDFGQQMAI